MTDNIDRKITEAIKRVAGKLAEECEECGGRGWWCKSKDCPSPNYCDNCDKQVTCPTCARWRELAELCWEDGWVLPRNPVEDKDAIVSLQKAQDWLSTVRAKLVSTIHAKDLDEIARRIGCKIEGLQIVDKGYTPNPTYTIPSLKGILVDLGLWERFAEWHYRQCHYKETFTWMTITWHDVISVAAYADILTDPLLLMQAANNAPIWEEK